MHQDAYGFMWFGTYDGLNLYDGKKVTTFRYESNNPNSLSGNTIHHIQSLGSDYLWIASQVGLNKFSLKERKVVESYPEYKQSDFLTTDGENNTWMIAKENYISYYDSLRKNFHDIYFKGANINDIKSFFIDKEKRLCAVKSNGILQFLTLKINNPSTFDHSLSVQEQKFHDRIVNQVFYEDELIYFIDEDGNLFFYDSSKQQKILLRNISDIINQYGIISSLVFFRQEIFIAFMHSGLVKLDVSNHYKAEPVNMTIGVFGLQKDRFQDAIWVGTDGQGVELYYREKDTFSNILLENLPFIARRPIRAFYTDEENTLWIGTKGDGVLRIKNYDRYANSKVPAESIQRFVTHAGLYENPVYCFVRSTYNNRDLWLGTDGGISYYSYKDKEIYHLEDSEETGALLSNVHTLCEVNDSTLWVSSKGLYQITIDKNRKLYRVKNKKNYIFQQNGTDIYDEYYTMVYDGNSRIFLGGRRGYGVVYIDIHTGKYDFISMDNAKNKGLGDIICLYLDRDSTLYIGAGSGLTKMTMYRNKENEIKQFGRNDGIINDMIHGILEDNKGIIWLSTNKGLVKYNPENDSFFNVKSSHISVVEYSDNACWLCPFTGRLFFGGVNGFVWIEPKNGDEIPVYEPKLLFTELNCFGIEQTLYDYNNSGEKKLVLPAGQNTFQLSFAVLNYTHVDNYDFSYLLENYNSNWISLQKENKINFTKLPPGDYILKVKYKDDVQPADDNMYSLPIKILPPWYLSAPAYGIYLLLFLALTCYTIYYIRLKFKKKQEMIARKIKEEQKEKMYESKLRFFTNITHEFYTPLTLINGALEQIKRESGTERLKKYTGILQSNILNLNELIQEVLDYRKIEESELDSSVLKNVSITTILNNLLNSFSEITKQNDVSLTSSIPENLYWCTDRASFKKIVSNLISNAFKYTPVGGTITVSVAEENNSLKIVVYNTGHGIEPNKLGLIFNRYRILENADVNANNQMTARNGLGLFICHSMTKLLQGEIEVDSIVDNYTQFTVVLPNLMQKNVPITTEKFPQNKSEEKNKAVKANILPVKQTTLSKPEGASGLILVIDDNQEIVEMVSDILSPEYTLAKAYNAKEALTILKTQTPSLIITDIMMPEIDGLSFIKMVREDRYNKHIPIIVLSAKIEEQDQVKGYEIGADAYITKPFSSEILRSMVNRLLLNKEEIKNYYDTTESAFEYNQGRLMHQKDKEFIAILTEIIKENISNTELGPEFIADKMKISSRNLYRQLKKILNISPSDFLKDYKLVYASKLFISTNLSIKEIIYKIGITNKSYFYREFAKKYNLSPKQYKESYKKEMEKTENKT
jgi:signal transduction histidine kinase/ligand-binding sensor domain-containing protein/AraC-like DNA-binding protein